MSVETAKRLEVPGRLMEKRPNAFALSYGGELDRGRAWRAGYALIDPDKEPTDGELCVFGSLEDAKMLPWPGKDGEGALLGGVAGVLDVEPPGEGTGALQELGTPSCPYRFGCEAVSAELEYYVRHASEWTDVSVELAYMLMDARGEKRSHERLNEILNGALRACRKRSEKDACARN